MSAKGQLLQDPFLNALRKEHVPVSIYLVNGIKLQGQIESFDQYVVLLKNTVTQMVYKHAISTVVPARAVNLVPGALVRRLSGSPHASASPCSHPPPRRRRPAAGSVPRSCVPCPHSENIRCLNAPRAATAQSS